MTKTYYVVYSVRTKLGSGFGRNTLTCERAIETMDHIDQAEKELLRGLRERAPEEMYDCLFLVNWREIAPETPSSAIME